MHFWLRNPGRKTFHLILLLRAIDTGFWLILIHTHLGPLSKESFSCPNCPHHYHKFARIATKPGPFANETKSGHKPNSIHYQNSSHPKMVVTLKRKINFSFNATLKLK